jgi:hypothetical protein
MSTTIISLEDIDDALQEIASSRDGQLLQELEEVGDHSCRQSLGHGCYRAMRKTVGEEE